jgi:hypothetical protein
MFRAGRRLFSIASLALIVVAALHTLGHFLTLGVVEALFVLSLVPPRPS